MSKRFKRNLSLEPEIALDSDGSYKEESELEDEEEVEEFGVNELPSWIFSPQQKHVSAVKKGKFKNLSLIFEICKQSTSYSKASIVAANDHRVFKTRYVVCDLCKQVFYGSGGHLIRHRDKGCKSNVKTSTTQQSVPAQESTKSEFHDAIVDYFTKSGKPLYHLENRQFQELILSVAKIGSKKGTARTLVDNKLDEKKEEIIGMMEPFFEDKSITILADFGKLNYDFLSVKTAFLMTVKDENGVQSWKMVVAPLAMAATNMKSKDSDNVYEEIRKAVEQFSPTADLSQLYLVADGGSNIRSAGSQYFFKYIRCAAHASELIGKRMLKPYKKQPATENEKKILQKYLDIMENCRLLTMELKADKMAYKTLGVPLVTPNDTRWMTGFNCCQQVYQHLNKLIAQISTFNGKAEFYLMEVSKPESRKLYEELAGIYKSLVEVNDFFQKNDTTISEVLPAYLGLLDDVKDFSEKRSVSNNNKVLLKFASLAIRKQIGDLSSCHYLAYYLNPNYKNIVELQDRLDEHMLYLDAEALINEAIEDCDQILNVSCHKTQVTASTPSSSSGDSFLARRMKKSPTPVFKSLSYERSGYDTDSNIADPMLYWISCKNRFPKLFNIAKKVFSAPASEADVERSFSVLKNIYSENRRSLDLEYLQKLMLVRQFENLNMEGR